MKKEIDFLQQENEQLVGQGATLQETVNQRQEIFNMMFSKQIGEEAHKEELNKKKKGEYKKDESAYKRARYEIPSIKNFLGRSLIIEDCMIWPKDKQRRLSY